MNSLRAVFASLMDSVRDLLPIILVIAFFQLAVLQQPIPDFGDILVGILFVVIGLTLFVHGLNLGLFPIGETMAYAFASKGSVLWLLLFAFALGFGTTVAEPALIAVANEAAVVAASGEMIEDNEEAREAYAFGLRMTVALAVGVALVLGVFRIITNWRDACNLFTIQELRRHRLGQPVSNECWIVPDLHHFVVDDLTDDVRKRSGRHSSRASFRKLCDIKAFAATWRP